MSLDLNRLWTRNFGRDDRVISGTGKEARFPYLDLQVMRYMAKAPLKFLCDWEDHRGKGDKRILRKLAQQEYGLKLAGSFEKRAI